jgi:hypothetical protein
VFHDCSPLRRREVARAVRQRKSKGNGKGKGKVGVMSNGLANLSLI